MGISVGIELMPTSIGSAMVSKVGGSLDGVYKFMDEAALWLQPQDTTPLEIMHSWFQIATFIYKVNLKMLPHKLSH